MHSLPMGPALPYEIVSRTIRTPHPSSYVEPVDALPSIGTVRGLEKAHIPNHFVAGVETMSVRATTVCVYQYRSQLSFCCGSWKPYTLCRRSLWSTQTKTCPPALWTKIWKKWCLSSKKRTRNIKNEVKNIYIYLKKFTIHKLYPYKLYQYTNYTNTTNESKSLVSFFSSFNVFPSCSKWSSTMIFIFTRLMCFQ